ncbi:MAG TPA: glycosyltransferase [Thermomicrobiales bacterium]|nr:glycosyltransferase [Thermomicrobiales bacterium]
MLVCFSHLRWDFVWQRPQHLLSRFARQMEIVVVEEPVFAPGPASLRIAQASHHLTVVTPVLPDDAGLPGGYGPATNPLVRALLTEWFERSTRPTAVKTTRAASGRATASGGGIATLEPPALSLGVPGPIFWYYTPMALGAEPAGVRPSLVVYDAMDELAKFRFAPPALVEREARLMREADLVFTGGPSLYRARQGRHPSVHCFPSGVEAAHFAQATRPEFRHPELAGLDHPVVGFYGVIDERVDFDLISSIAAARPEWTIALVGPTAKVAPDDLPQAPKIRYFGKRSYDELPAFLAGFDVAILPFARNEATQFISPTKTLEYMAGGKPIVSTPIADVIDLYGEVVAFAETPDRFVSAIEDLLEEPAGARRLRQERAQTVLARHAWDTIAREMLALMDAALARAYPTLLPVVASAAGERAYATGAA